MEVEASGQLTQLALFGLIAFIAWFVAVEQPKLAAVPGLLNSVEQLQAQTIALFVPRLKNGWEVLGHVLSGHGAQQPLDDHLSDSFPGLAGASDTGTSLALGWEIL